MITFKIKKNIRYFLCIYLFLLIPPSFASSSETKGIWINLGTGNIDFTSDNLDKWHCSTTTIKKNKYTLLFISEELYKKAVNDLSIENSSLNEVNGEKAKKIFTKAFSLLGKEYSCEKIYKKPSNKKEEIEDDSPVFENDTNFTPYDKSSTPTTTIGLVSVAVPVFQQKGHTFKEPTSELGCTLDNSASNVTIFSDRRIIAKVPIKSTSWDAYDLSLGFFLFKELNLNNSDKKEELLNVSHPIETNTQLIKGSLIQKKKTFNFEAEIPGQYMEGITRVEASLIERYNEEKTSFLGKTYDVYEEHQTIFIVVGSVILIAIVLVGFAVTKKLRSSDKSKTSRKSRSSRRERPKKQETASSS